MGTSPFCIETDQALVAIRGMRRGYIQLAQPQEVTSYQDLSDEWLKAARAWAATLEALGAKRVLWIMLSEMVPHLHLHVYPRWTDEEVRGIALFEQREQAPQPAWDAATESALASWAAAHRVAVQPLPTP